jgi:rhodanese-related sulfurtransferase
MRQGSPDTVSTLELHHLLTSAAPLWLVFAPDRVAFAAGHIPGSLTASDAQLLTTLPTGTPVIVYGEHRAVTRARVLAAELAATGRNARWYAGGLQAWGAAGLPVERASGPGTSQ